MAETVDAPARLSLAQTRHIVKDLFDPNPAIYWADFLLSTFAGMAAFGLVRRVLTPFSIEQGLMFVVCGLCFYRAVLFTHELTHMRDKTFGAFRVVWNLLIGIPFLMPSFTYYTHVEHHMRKKFSTHEDGEYLPLAPLQNMLTAKIVEAGEYELTVVPIKPNDIKLTSVRVEMRRNVEGNANLR